MLPAPCLRAGIVSCTHIHRRCQVGTRPKKTRIVPLVGSAGAWAPRRPCGGTAGCPQLDGAHRPGTRGRGARMRWCRPEAGWWKRRIFHGELFFSIVPINKKKKAGTPPCHKLLRLPTFFSPFHLLIHSLEMQFKKLFAISAVTGLALGADNSMYIDQKET